MQKCEYYRYLVGAVPYVEEGNPFITKVTIKYQKSKIKYNFFFTYLPQDCSSMATRFSFSSFAGAACSFNDAIDGAEDPCFELFVVHCLTWCDLAADNHKF